VIAAALLAGATGCESRESPGAPPGMDLERAREALGASFVGRRAGGPRALMDPDPIVQPPKPDSALRGDAAVDYLERLARESDLARSELTPTDLSREGGFLLERGTWFLEAEERTLRSRYTIRWRETPAGWKVVLWRWTPFR
jgi:hypothetical protein